MKAIDEEYFNIVNRFRNNIERYTNEYSHQVIEAHTAMDQISVTVKILNEELEEFYEKHK